MDPVSGQGLFRGAVLLCRHSYGGTDGRYDESQASHCLGPTFLSTERISFWLYLRLQKCWIQAVKGTGLSSGFDCGVQQRAYTMWHPRNPKWIVRFPWRNPQLHCLSCHCSAEIVEPKGLFPSKMVVTFVTVSAVCVFILLRTYFWFFFFLRLVHCNVLNIGVSNCQLKFHCLSGFSGKKLPWND
jgi:hypothetical protein